LCYSRRRHTRFSRDWSSDVCSSDLGALAVWTGKYTGRSPKDRFLVKNGESENTVDWGPINQPIEPEAFDKLEARVIDYLSKKEEIYCFDGYAGADPRYRVPVRVINEYAWHNLFIRQLLLPPKPEELAGFRPEVTIWCAPGCQEIGRAHV